MYVSSTTPPSLAPRMQPTAAPAAAPSAAAPPPQPAAPPQQPTASSAPAPSTPGAQAGTSAAQLTQRINSVVTATKQLDTVWMNSMQQLKAAVSTLGKDGKLDPAAAQAASRILFIGKVLQVQVPEGAAAAAAALPAGTTPSAAIINAEKSYVDALSAVIKASTAVMQDLPNDLPKDVADVVLAIRERVTDSLYAVKFSRRLAPPPAPQATNSAPTGTASPSATPPPAAQSSSTAAPAPAK